MRRLRLGLVCASLLLATSIGVAADTDEYRCRVDRVDAADGTGPELKLVRGRHVGREFTVDRRSGLMDGLLKNSYGTRPLVIDAGSTETSFKVVTTMRRTEGGQTFSSVHALVINEFEDGKEKSFAFLDNGIVYFGTCVHP